MLLGRIISSCLTAQGLFTYGYTPRCNTYSIHTILIPDTYNTIHTIQRIHEAAVGRQMTRLAGFTQDLVCNRAPVVTLCNQAKWNDSMTYHGKLLLQLPVFPSPLHSRPLRLGLDCHGVISPAIAVPSGNHHGTPGRTVPRTQSSTSSVESRLALRLGMTHGSHPVRLGLGLGLSVSQGLEAGLGLTLGECVGRRDAICGCVGLQSRGGDLRGVVDALEPCGILSPCQLGCIPVRHCSTTQTGHCLLSQCPQLCNVCKASYRGGDFNVSHFLFIASFSRQLRPTGRETHHEPISGRNSNLRQSVRRCFCSGVMQDCGASDKVSEWKDRWREQDCQIGRTWTAWQTRFTLSWISLDMELDGQSSGEGQTLGQGYMHVALEHSIRQHDEILIIP